MRRPTAGKGATATHVGAWGRGSCARAMGEACRHARRVRAPRGTSPATPRVCRDHVQVCASLMSNRRSSTCRA